MHIKLNDALYPPYSQVLGVIINSYPDNIIVTEEKCEVTNYIKTSYYFHLICINTFLFIRNHYNHFFKAHCEKTFAKHF